MDRHHAGEARPSVGSRPLTKDIRPNEMIASLRHTACPPWRVTDELAAYKLAQLPFPGVFGVFYESDRPTKNALEKKWIDTTREKLGHPSDLALLQKTFDRMK
jgi:hypothetical protein